MATIERFNSVSFKNLFNQSKNTFLYDDYIGFFNWSKGGNQAGTGAGIAFIASIDSNHSGVEQCSTGTTATGWSCLSTTPNSFKFSTVTNELFIYEFVMRTDVLSDATNEYVVYFGLGDNIAANTEPSNGCYFKYVRTTSVNYQICTASAGTRTTTTTSIAYPASTYSRYKITVLGNTLANFYINDTLLGPIATNINTSNPICAFMKIVKTVGTTARQIYEDSFLIDKDVVLSLIHI